jgi:hypothetical protein
VPLQPPRGWFRRHLACIIPAGCLLALLIVAGLILGALLLGVREFRKMAPYKDALAAARANAEVIDALGRPIEVGTFGSYNMKVTGSTGSLDMSIPISGPKGRGTLYVVATKSAGQWTIERLEVEIEGRRGRIDLLRPNVI